MESMDGTYWRIETVQPQTPGDDRCILLYGQEEEIVGPMTIELAEAWIDYFDNRRLRTDTSPPDLKQIAPAKDRSLMPPA